MADAEIERITLAASQQVTAHQHFRSFGGGEGGGFVGAIIRNHDQPVAPSHLRNDGAKRAADDQRFVMCGHQDRHPGVISRH